MQILSKNAEKPRTRSVRLPGVGDYYGTYIYAILPSNKQYCSE